MKELMQLIGKRGYINVNGWIVALEVTDVKKVFGHEKLEVIQPGREFSQWINRESFTVVEVKTTSAHYNESVVDAVLAKY